MNRAMGMNESQASVLRDGTLTAITSGMAGRYHCALRVGSERLDRLAALPDDPLVDRFRTQAEAARPAVTAETPLAFKLKPSNMAAGVHAVKVDPITGAEVPCSDVQIGLVGGLAGEGQPTGEFTVEDLDLAVGGLQKQQQVGLTYGMDGSPFLRNP